TDLGGGIGVLILGDAGNDLAVAVERLIHVVQAVGGARNGAARAGVGEGAGRRVELGITRQANRADVGRRPTCGKRADAEIVHPLIAVIAVAGNLGIVGAGGKRQDHLLII